MSDPHRKLRSARAAGLMPIDQGRFYSAAAHCERCGGVDGLILDGLVFVHPDEQQCCWPVRRRKKGRPG